MMRAERGLERELVAFLKHRRIERAVAPEVRDRVIASARAVIASGGAVPAARPPVPVAATRSFGRGRSAVRVALAASFAVAAGAVGAAAALQARRDPTPPALAQPQSVVAAPRVPARSAGRAWADGPTEEAPAAPAASVMSGKPTRPRRVMARVDPFAAELDLLQHAHAAYTRRDFSTALTLLSEHARRFPKGNLAEQREALRMRSLAGAGRGADAHRAAADFAHRFPRSVLLPRIEDGPESPVP